MKASELIKKGVKVGDRLFEASIHGMWKYKVIGIFPETADDRPFISVLTDFNGIHSAAMIFDSSAGVELTEHAALQWMVEDYEKKLDKAKKMLADYERKSVGD